MEKYISFNQAVLLKNLGYPQTNCGGYYKDNGEIENGFTDLGLGTIACPALSLVQSWFRKEHKIHIEVSYNDRFDNYYVNVFMKDDPDNEMVSEFIEYDDALSTGIDIAINMLKSIKDM